MIRDGYLERTIALGEIESTTRLRLPEDVQGASTIELAKLWQQAVLRGGHSEFVGRANPGHSLAVADLFCGCGGFTQGVSDAARALGFDPHVVFCADVDRDALSVYRRNFSPDDWYDGSVSDLVDFQWTATDRGAVFKYPPVLLNDELRAMVGRLDVLVAGPPCQGHSNLNNHTRRDDPRNLLYLTVPAIAVATRAKCIIVENVPEVVNDSRSVISLALDLFQNSGYLVDSRTVSALDFGTAQTRRRHIVVAVREDVGVQPWFGILEPFKDAPLKLCDVIADLESRPTDDIFDATAELSKENQMRIDHLFDNDLYDLPNEVRPDCHKNGHTYKSVYGRLKWDEPSPTITTGFLTPGRGRYVHPRQRRTLTPHEAARIQAFPDSFVFKSVDGKDLSKATLTKIIGQAVPPPLGHAAALVAFGAAMGKVPPEAGGPIGTDRQKSMYLKVDENAELKCDVNEAIQEAA